MTDQITGATNQLSLFGKTFKHINEDLSKGYGLTSYFKILPKEDINNLKLYVKGLETATDEQLLFDKIKAQMEVERFNNTKNKIIKYIKENILSFNEVDMMDIKVILDMLEDK